MRRMNNMIHKFRWFWAWEDEIEENWLRELSNQGYHFKSVIFIGLYTFEVGPKKDYVYRLDYAPKRVDDEYLNLFRDAGWTYMGSMNSWQYFRKEAAGSVVPEIFTDPESKVQKYKRIFKLMAAIMPLMIINVINCLIRADEPVWLALGIFFISMTILFSVGLRKLLERISNLKHL
jgi:hypothetical protein